MSSRDKNGKKKKHKEKRGNASNNISNLNRHRELICMDHTYIDRW